MEHNHFLGMAHHYLRVYFSLLLNLVLPSWINEGGVLSIVLGMIKLWESSRNLFSQVTWGVIGDERANIDSVHRAQHRGPDLQRDAKLPGRLRPQTLPLKQKMRLHNHDSSKSSGVICRRRWKVKLSAISWRIEAGVSQTPLCVQ